MSNISEDLCEQLKSSRFALQVDEATAVVTDAHLITYFRCMLENDIKEDFLFCKPVDGRATSLKSYIFWRRMKETERSALTEPSQFIHAPFGDRKSSLRGGLCNFM
jgi:hypothetical protein